VVQPPGLAELQLLHKMLGMLLNKLAFLLCAWEQHRARTSAIVLPLHCECIVSQSAIVWCGYKISVACALCLPLCM